MKKLFLLLSMFCLSTSKAQTGSLDSAFGSNGWVTALDTRRFGEEQFVADVAVQPDGKTVTLFWTSQSINIPPSAKLHAKILVRHLKNGSIDYSFGRNGYVVLDPEFHFIASKVLVLNNGEILVAGSEMIAFGNYAFSVTCLHANGEVNRNFGVGGTAIADFTAKGDVLSGAAVQPDGKIVVVGYSSRGSEEYSQFKNFAAARFLPDGNTDLSFGDDGKVIYDRGDQVFQANDIVVQRDGKIVVGGYLANETGSHFALGRMKPDGSPDAGFGQDGIVISNLVANGIITSLALQQDGKILAGGNAFTDRWDWDFAITRFNLDGTPDMAFGNNGAQVTNIADLFKYSGQSSDEAKKILVRPDGKIVIAGTSDLQLGEFTHQNFVIAQYTGAGSLDRRFSSDGVQFINFFDHQDNTQAAAIASDGKITVAGNSKSWDTGESFYALSRVNPDGSSDNTWDGDGLVLGFYPENSKATGFSGVVAQPDGKVVAVGFSRHLSTVQDFNFFVARYNPDGTPDLGFDNDGKVSHPFGNWPKIEGMNAQAFAVAVQKDGKILVAGEAHDLSNGSWDIVVARYLENGSLDPAFGMGGTVFTDLGGVESGKSICVQKDGKIVVGGLASAADGHDFALVRYHENGSLDLSFDHDGKLTTDINGDNGIYSIAIQPDGKILAGGFAANGNDYDFAIARYDADGSLDRSFANFGKQIVDFGSTTDLAYSLALQSDGKILLAGDVFKPGNRDFGIVRINNDGSLDLRFGTSGKQQVDISVWDHASSIAIQPDKKILVGGSVLLSGREDLSLLRINEDGRLDLTFGFNGFVAKDLGAFETIEGITIHEGRIYGAGSYDGKLDGKGLIAAFKMGPLAPSLKVNDITVSESYGQAKMSVTLSNASNRPLLLQYESVDGTAKHGQDFKKVKGTALIPAGNLHTDINVTIRTDNLKEGLEYFDIKFTPIAVAPDVVLEDLTGRITITDGPMENMGSIYPKASIRQQQALAVTIAPNPSSDVFTLYFTSKQPTPVMVRVVDVTGRVVEQRSPVYSNSLKVGSRYRPGTYYAEVTQGDERVILKLVKTGR